MKPLIKRRRKFSFQLKMIIAFLVAMGLVAAFFSWRFSGSQKKSYPDLRFSDKIKEPESSSEGGFYKNELIVKLTTTDPVDKIYYTTDGSEPSLASPLYNKPILIVDRSAER